jgi:Ni,Fe-hydrogenase I cytochrome b subunit
VPRWWRRRRPQKIGNLTNESWQNPWKLAAVAMALVIVTVVATGLVVHDESYGNAYAACMHSRGYTG